MIKRICMDIDNLADLYVEERPFLTGGALEVNEMPERRKDLETVLKQRLLSGESLLNEIIPTIES